MMQRARNHENGGDRDDGRMTEAGKGAFGGHDAGEDGGQECPDGNRVVAPPAPDEERQRRQ